MKERDTDILRIEWCSSGDIRNADSNGIGYGMLYWDDVLKFAKSGGVVIDTNGKKYDEKKIIEIMELYN